MIRGVTEEYYSRFCGARPSELAPGMHFICSPERDEYLGAYGCKYSIWLLIKDNLCVAAYSPKYEELFEGLRGLECEEVVSELDRRFALKKTRLMIFEGERVSGFREARALSPEDYPLYEDFFREAYPDADPDGWLREYFLEKADGCFTGYHSGGRLLSVCDLPDMPYMQGTIQHTGIMTLKNQRRKGYDLCAAALATHNLLEMGVCPQWECGADNAASVGLAGAIGYGEYGTAYILEEKIEFPGEKILKPY